MKTATEYFMKGIIIPSKLSIRLEKAIMSFPINPCVFCFPCRPALFEPSLKEANPPVIDRQSYSVPPNHPTGFISGPINIVIFKKTVISQTSDISSIIVVQFRLSPTVQIRKGSTIAQYFCYLCKHICRKLILGVKGYGFDLFTHHTKPFFSPLAIIRRQNHFPTPCFPLYF